MRNQREERNHRRCRPEQNYLLTTMYRFGPAETKIPNLRPLPGCANFSFGFRPALPIDVLIQPQLLPEVLDRHQWSDFSIFLHSEYLCKI